MSTTAAENNKPMLPIGIANAAYPDGLVGQCAEDDAEHGDTLALFIARELKDVRTQGVAPAEQFRIARDAIETAIRELEAVADALDNAYIDAMIAEDPNWGGDAEHPVDRTAVATQDADVDED